MRSLQKSHAALPPMTCRSLQRARGPPLRSPSTTGTASVSTHARFVCSITVCTTPVQILMPGPFASMTELLPLQSSPQPRQTVPGLAPVSLQASQTDTLTNDAAGAHQGQDGRPAQPLHRGAPARRPCLQVQPCPAIAAVGEEDTAEFNTHSYTPEFAHVSGGHAVRPGLTNAPKSPRHVACPCLCSMGPKP